MNVLGTQDWTYGNGDLYIAEHTQAPGEVGTANTVTIIGCKKFLERWKSTIMAHLIIQLLTPEAQVGIKIHKKRFQWTDPLCNETIDDGHSFLNKVLKMMRLDIQTKVYAELAKIKSIKPVDYAFNIVKWHSAMESKSFPSIPKSQEPTMNFITLWIMEICPKTITLLLCKLMDNHQTCSNPITSPKQKINVWHPMTSPIKCNPVTSPIKTDHPKTLLLRQVSNVDLHPLTSPKISLSDNITNKDTLIH
jgi:hypothetical protein